MTTRTPCPHCGRSIAVIGNRGQHARHHCVDNPATMRPVERVQVTRQRERTCRTRLVSTQTSLRQAEKWLRPMRVASWATTVALLFSASTLWLHGVNQFSVIGFLLTLVGVLCSRARLRSITELVGQGRRDLPARQAEHAAALSTLTDIEAALPADVVWPELHARPTDLDNLEGPR